MPIPSLGERRPAPDDVGLGDWLPDAAADADDADDAEDAEDADDAEEAEDSAEDAEDAAEEAEDAAEAADEAAEEAEEAADAADDAADDAEDAPEMMDELPDAEEGTVVTETDPGTVTVAEERGALPLTVVVMLMLVLGLLATDEGTARVDVSLATGEEKEPDIPVNLEPGAWSVSVG